jgi:hypothetical protein
MQDVQNIPNPDVNSTETNDDFGSHSDVEQDLDQTDIENPNSEGRKNDDIERQNETIPVPPDTEPSAPVEEPPETKEDSPIREEQNEPKRIA